MSQLLITVICIPVAILIAAPLGVRMWKSIMRDKWADLAWAGWKPYDQGEDR